MELQGPFFLYFYFISFSVIKIMVIGSYECSIYLEQTHFTWRYADIQCGLKMYVFKCNFIKFHIMP